MQRPTKQSMNELKLRRLLEHNQRLRDDFTRPRINVSEASSRYVHSGIFFEPSERELNALCLRQSRPLLQDDKRPSGASPMCCCILYNRYSFSFARLP